MRTGLIAIALTLSQSIAAFGQESGNSRAVFERLKRLVGTWTATDKDRPGSSQIFTYKMAGGGRVLVEEMDGTLNSVYHLDIDQMMLTHYCGSGNQPRMRVRAVDDRHIAFEMFDITNLANPRGYRTTHADIVFVDANRIEIRYRGRSAERGESTQVLELTRRKG